MAAFIDDLQDLVGRGKVHLFLRDEFFCQEGNFFYLGKRYVVQASENGVYRLRVFGDEEIIFPLIERIFKNINQVIETLKNEMEKAEWIFHYELKMIVTSWRQYQ
jgi:hypothetical protein